MGRRRDRAAGPSGSCHSDRFDYTCVAVSGSIGTLVTIEVSGSNRIAHARAVVLALLDLLTETLEVQAEPFCCRRGRKKINYDPRLMFHSVEHSLLEDTEHHLATNRNRRCLRSYVVLAKA